MWSHSNFIFNKPVAWIATLLLLCSLGVDAQNFDYGSDWYTSRSNQALVRLVVEEDGIYRVSFQDLQNAGFDLTGVNARNLHIIYRGEEQPIYVSQTAAGQLNFLEFFGQKNDGWLDSVMYRDPLSGLADDSHESLLYLEEAISHLYQELKAINPQLDFRMRPFSIAPLPGTPLEREIRDSGLLVFDDPALLGGFWTACANTKHMSYLEVSEWQVRLMKVGDQNKGFNPTR